MAGLKPVQSGPSSKTGCWKKGELYDGGAGQERVTKLIDYGSCVGEDGSGDAVRCDVGRKPQRHQEHAGRKSRLVLSLHMIMFLGSRGALTDLGIRAGCGQ